MYADDRDPPVEKRPRLKHRSSRGLGRNSTQIRQPGMPHAEEQSVAQGPATRCLASAGTGAEDVGVQWSGGNRTQHREIDLQSDIAATAAAASVPPNARRKDMAA